MATGPHPITKQLLYLLVLAFLPLLPAVACAETDSTITIGYPENFPPYYSIDDQGKPVGFAIEVIEDLARQLKLPVEHR